MGARQDLNTIYVAGSVGLAGLLGLVTGSFTLFMIASTVMIVAAIDSGGIRGKGRVQSGRRHQGR
jgi:hypothetical protein